MAVGVSGSYDQMQMQILDNGQKLKRGSNDERTASMT